MRSTIQKVVEWALQTAKALLDRAGHRSWPVPAMQQPSNISQTRVRIPSLDYIGLFRGGT